MAISQIVQNSISPSVELGRPFVAKPSITSPANNATGILPGQVITASPFLSLYGISQANAQWQLSTSPTFAFINIASTINGSNTSLTTNTNSGLATSNTYYARVRYSDTSNNSSAYSDTIQFTTAAQFQIAVEYLVVAGGGGGGSGRNGTGAAGGGGAGGLIYGSNSTFGSALTNYPVSVGSGGVAALRANDDTRGGSGSTSNFSTFSAVGGGGGGSGPSSGGPGGSGGGGGGPNAGGTGTPGQGNNGGPAGTAGGGGGGAGAAGTSGNPSPFSGPGGVGLAYSISGSSVFYAGGGGGGQWQPPGAPGTGGNGGGGPGGTPVTPGTPGTANRGGGGGGGGENTSPGTPGGTGGSGVVILKYPSAFTISNPGGGLTLSSSPSGSNTVTTITAGTGNISWS